MGFARVSPLVVNLVFARVQSWEWLMGFDWDLSMVVLRGLVMRV